MYATISTLSTLRTQTLSLPKVYVCSNWTAFGMLFFK